MAVNPGQLLVDFIGLQGTPVSIVGAVQTQLASGGADLSGYAVAAASAMHGLTSLATTLSGMPEGVMTKALGGAAGVLAIKGLSDNYDSYLTDINKSGAITDGTLLSALSNTTALLGVVAGVFGAPLLVTGLVAATSVALGYAAINNDDHDIANAAANLLTQAQSLCDSLGADMSNFADGLANGFIDFGLSFGNLLNGFEDGIGDTVPSLFTSAANWTQPKYDPLILDLDGDGLETVGINTASPILFDHNGDGIQSATGWVLPDDGFLVLDRNGNGVIDSGLELFGDSTPLSSGGNAVDGFAALAQEDTNHDGKVDASDARFANLRIWRDLNQDGISQSDELATLAELDICSISIAKSENSTLLANGNVVADLGTYTKTDGSLGTLGETAQLADIDLADNPFYREFTDAISITPEAAALPDMQASGQVRDLREAMSLSDDLTAMVASLSEMTRAQMQSALDDLVGQWADTSTMKTSRQLAAENRTWNPDGMVLNFQLPNESSYTSTELSDEKNRIGRMLDILERFNGFTFVSFTTSGASTGSGVPLGTSGGSGGSRVLADNDSIWERVA